ncbi:MAG: hypothetical protein AB7P78_20560 [Candidatus Binatia bacterium]
MSVAGAIGDPYGVAVIDTHAGARGSVLVAGDQDGVRDSLTQVLREEINEVVAA